MLVEPETQLTRRNQTRLAMPMRECTDGLDGGEEEASRALPVCLFGGGRRCIGDEMELMGGMQMTYLHGGPGWAMTKAALQVSEAAKRTSRSPSMTT